MNGVDATWQRETRHYALVASLRGTPSQLTSSVNSVLASALAPTLRDEGFRRRGRTWTHDAPDAFRSCTVQSTSGEGGTITLNLGVSFKRFDHHVLGRRADDCQISVRIGELLPIPSDQWWVIFSGQEADAARSLGAVWREVGLPYVQAAANVEAYCEYVSERLAPTKLVEIARRFLA